MADERGPVWIGSMPAAYERYLVPTLFRPFAVDLAGRVSAHRPRRVLEVAAGTGVLTSELANALPDAAITATDLNQAMVDVGQAREPRADWRQADALQLPFADGSFDVVVCQFGAMFFPDKPAGFAEARRVLAADGRLVFNVWAALETHEFESAVVRVLERVFPEDPPMFLRSSVHGYADADAILADLAAAGFANPVIETVTLEGQSASASDLATGYCTGTPLQAAIESRADLAVIKAEVESEFTATFGPGPIRGQMAALVVEA